MANVCRLMAAFVHVAALNGPSDLRKYAAVVVVVVVVLRRQEW